MQKEIKIQGITSPNKGRTLTLTIPKEIVMQMKLEKGQRIRILYDEENGEIIIKPMEK